MLGERNSQNLLSAESTDAFHCAKRIIQQIVPWIYRVSGVDARCIRAETPTKLIGKGLQMLPSKQYTDLLKKKKQFLWIPPDKPVYLSLEERVAP